MDFVLSGSDIDERIPVLGKLGHLNTVDTKKFDAVFTEIDLQRLYDE